MREIIPVNGSDREWTSHRFILWFGACGTTRLMVWGNGLCDCLDEAVDWLEENAPGHLIDDQVEEEFRRLRAEGKSEEEAWEEAQVDTTCAGNHGRYLASWEWGIVAEDPSRAEVLELQGRGKS